MKLLSFLLSVTTLALVQGSTTNSQLCDVTSIPVGEVATPADGEYYEESRKQW